MKERFAKEDYRKYYFVTENPEAALEYIKNYKPEKEINKWFTDDSFNL